MATTRDSATALRFAQNDMRGYGEGEPEEKTRDNFTDPQSRIMKTSADGFQQCYNAQLAVEGRNQLIVATGVSARSSDQGKIRRGAVTPGSMAQAARVAFCRLYAKWSRYRSLIRLRVLKSSRLVALSNL